MNLKLEETKTYTVISINGMAMTSRTEIIKPVPTVKEDQYAFKPKNKRNPVGFKLVAKDMLVFEGSENLPIMVDSETNVMMGNACINFVTDKPKELAEWITKNNLNEEFTHWHAVLYFPVNRTTEDDGNQLYPEAGTGDHAVVQRIADKAGFVGQN